MTPEIILSFAVAGLGVVVLILECELNAVARRLRVLEAKDRP